MYIKVAHPKKRGRKRYNFEFEKARDIIRREGLPSRLGYDAWWRINTPSRIPKRPDRAYKTSFLGWNDFLGNNNIFPTYYSKKYASYNVAHEYAITSGIKSKEEWISRGTANLLPPGIPHRPDVYYITKPRRNILGKWVSWADFLGRTNDIITKIEITQKFVNLLVIVPLDEVNIYRLISLKTTNDKLIALLKKYNMRPIRIYIITTPWEPLLRNINITHYEDDIYHINNINEILYILDINYSHK